MRYFMTCLRLTLAQRLGSLRGLLALALIPALVLSVQQLLPRSEAATPVTVGVVEDDHLELWRLLEQRSDAVLEFVRTDEATLERNIAAGRWDCGLVVTDPGIDRGITVRIGPGSTVYPLVKETVAACLAQLISPDIARRFLTDSGIPMGDAPQELGESDRVLVNMTTPDGKPLQTPELQNRSIRDLLRWLLCVSMLVRLLFASADLGKWMASSAMKRTVPLRSSFVSLSARAVAEGILLSISACAAELALGDGIWGCLAVLGYVLFWLAASVLLAQLPRVTGALGVFVPFAVVLSLLLSSVLADISLISPMIGTVAAHLPVTLFLRICVGDPMAFLKLLLGSGLFLIPAWALSRRPQQKRVL